MADRGDTHYFVPKLNLWFAGSSVLFLIAVFWMVIDDWSASWKTYQREFARIELERAEAELAAPDAVATQEREAQLEAELEQVNQRLEAKANEIAEAEEAAFQAKGELWRITEEAKAIKEQYNWDKSQLEHHQQDHPEADHSREEAAFEALTLDLAQKNLEKENAEIAFKNANAALEALIAERTEAEDELKAAGKSLALIRKKKDKLDPGDPVTKAAELIRDFPGLDFIGPNLKVNKVVLEDLTFELNFTKKKRIDMCMTCHVAIDRDGFTEEELEQPHRSHPRLDLYLTAKSAHPMNDVGCTICHRGAGEALSFQHADHYPSNAKEGEEWYEEYHWHKQHHWDYPMLSSEHIEASCIQCHKDSMELIADDAPKVTEGYHLVERYGCYACHKIEWFPTKRKPGPSLKNFQAKLKDDGFIDSWIAQPKAFRPTTWMPQIFHLENWPADESVVTSKYEEGRDILGKEWNDSAIASIVAYLEDMAPERELAAIPVEGDAERGREVMRVTGCFACHNAAPWEESEETPRDPAFEPGRYNEHGPNLRGVATKLRAEWLYAWIKNPQEYWPDTNMPNLRLSDQDAADITAYMMEDPDGIFSDTPEGWQPEDVAYDLEVLQEQARWFFSRDGRGTLERRFAGEDEEYRWDRADTLAVAVGEKFVLAQGCYSCHEISGLESTMPIGAELTNWASKTVDKLDWAAMDRILEKERNWHIHEREEYKMYRENWLGQKLDAPRSFDREKIKNPMEKLKMPWFDFTDDQISSITTFVVGLVDDEVQKAKMHSTSEQKAMDTGMRALRQKNCLACHVVEPARVRFLDEDGHEHDVPAQLLAIGDDTTPPPARDFEALLSAIESYEEYYEEEIEEVGIRLLEPSPGVGAPGEQIFIPKDDLVGFTAAVGGDFVDLVTDYYFKGIELHDPEAEDPEDAFYAWNLGEEGEVQDVDGELRLYLEEPYDKVRWTFAPPVLLEEGYKVQRDWFYGFLKDPVSLRQQIRTKMPTFHYRDGEAEGIADYFANRAQENWPSKYARTMRLVLGLDLKKDLPAREWPAVMDYKDGGSGLSADEVAEGAGLTAETVLAIEAGAPVETAASFPALFEYGSANGFFMNGPTNPAYETIQRRAPSYLAERHAFIGTGQELAVQAVNCYQCHFHDGQDPDQKATPIAWAPDLAISRERLREAWLKDWLTNPGLIYPGTAMPANFGADPPQYQDVYPESSNDQQIEAVLDFLYNFDRAPTPSD